MQMQAVASPLLPATPEATPLYGRQAELERIGALLDAARASRSGVLVLRGEAGIGKSALLEQAGERAGAMRVLSCRGTESERRLPFAALHQLVRRILDHADAIPGVQASALRGALGFEPSARAGRFLVSLAVLSLLAEAAESAPLLCAVDDAHWLDDASASALLFAARRLGAERIAMLFAGREGEEARFDPVGLPELRLAGLDPDAARALLERCAAGRLARDVAERLVNATAGNPLALLELVAELTEAQRSGAEPIFGPLPVGAHVERSFLRRVRGLPRATQQLVLLAAADDSGDLTAVLDAAARLDIAAGALDEAERAGLIRVRGMRLEFRHPLVRSAVYHGAPLSQRLAAHRALADVLVGAVTAERRSWHRAAASVEPDPAVVAELEQTARRAHERGAYGAASRGFERAAALSPDDAQRARLLTRAAENAWLPGEVARARTLLARARALAGEPIARADVARLAGLIELACGVPAEACRMLFRAGTAVAPVDAERALYLFSLAALGGAYARDREAIVAIADSAECLDVPGGAANRFLLVRLAGLRAHFAGDFEAAAPKLKTTLETACEADVLNPEQLADRFALGGPVGWFLCDDRAVLALHRAVAARAREHGAVMLLGQTLPWIALGDIWAGHWPSAAAQLSEGVELARAAGQHQIEAHMLAVQALLAALRGDEDECRALAAESLELALARRLVHVHCCATWALLVLELGLGRADAALAHAHALPRTAGVEWDALDRIEAAFRSGDRATARRWLDEFEPWANGSAAPWGTAVALHCRALLAEGDDEAARLFEDALALHERASRPFERARTELAFGELLRRARRRSDARVHLRAALQQFEMLGSALWAERARTELRASGETSRKRDPSTLDQLTAQELQIAQLVAQGRTNRDVAAQLFLSPRTIDFHLRNVFRKLGISSRIELVRGDLARSGA